MSGMNDLKEVDLKEFQKLRWKLLLRALYGEFAATFIYYFCVFGSLANGYQNQWSSEILDVAVAIVAAFASIAVIYTFSNVSGAIFNPAISLAFWLTGKLSNRKCICYMTIQLIASMAAMSMVYVCFPSPDQALFDFISVTPQPGVSLWKIWMTEFLTTGILTYVAFTIVYEDAAAQMTADQSFRAFTDENQGLTVFAATPQSRSGFSPFVIGFILAALVLFTGASGAAMNPCRLFGPAVFSGKWASWYVYYSAEFVGASLAGVVAHSLHNFKVSTDEVDQRLSLAASGGANSSYNNNNNINKNNNIGNGNGTRQPTTAANDMISNDTEENHGVHVDEESNLILTPKRLANNKVSGSVGGSGSVTERINASLSGWTHARLLKPSSNGNGNGSGKSSKSHASDETHTVDIRSPLMAT
jgi:glycerol uptake facilitator-like aquaporin